MIGIGRKYLAVISAVFAAVTLSGCAAYQGVEPIIMPPANYQADNAVKVEFVHPALLGVRCAERGVRFLGMPGVNSGACADHELITMPNPCFAVAGGWYASVMCHELAHTNGWAHNHDGGSLFAQAPLQPASLSPRALQHASSMQGAQVAQVASNGTQSATLQPRAVRNVPVKVAAKPAPGSKAQALALLRTQRPAPLARMPAVAETSFGLALALPPTTGTNPATVSAFGPPEAFAANTMFAPEAHAMATTFYNATSTIALFHSGLGE